MKRPAAACLVGAAFALTVTAPASAGTQYQEMSVEIEVETDGSFVVTETIGVDFFSPRHGIFRILPEKYPYDDDHLRVTEVDVLSVSRDGSSEPYELTHEGDQDETLRIRIGDPDRTITGSHVYEVRYRVSGWLNTFPDHEELYWNAVGSYWESPYERAQVTVRGPDVVQWTCFSGPTYSTTPCDDLGSSDAAVRYGATGVGAGSDLTVVVGFRPGAIDVPAPELEEIWTDDLAFSPTTTNVGLAAVLGAGLFPGLVLLWRRGRDERHVGLHDPAPDDLVAQTLDADPDDAPVQFRPPAGLKPAHLGLLDDERVDPVDVGATVVDLAVRGHVLIEDRRADGDRSPDWVLLLRAGANPDDSLEPFEQRLIDGLEGEAEGGEVRLDDLKGEFHTEYKAVADLLYDDAMERTWFRKHPSKVRNAYIALAVLALVAGVGTAMLALAVRWKVGLAAIPLLLFGLLLLVTHRRMPAKTARGRTALVQARGFKKFIETAEKPEMNYAVEQGEFVRFLPYAVAFGAVEQWSRATRGLDVAAATAGWYTGPVFHDWGSFGNEFSDFSSSVGSGLASQPASSGGSGFSGGGFSGGGGGGGGGGSW